MKDQHECENAILEIQVRQLNGSERSIREIFEEKLEAWGNRNPPKFYAVFHLAARSLMHTANYKQDNQSLPYAEYQRNLRRQKRLEKTLKELKDFFTDSELDQGFTVINKKDESFSISGYVRLKYIFDLFETYLAFYDRAPIKKDVHFVKRNYLDLMAELFELLEIHTSQGEFIRTVGIAWNSVHEPAEHLDDDSWKKMIERNPTIKKRIETIRGK